MKVRPDRPATRRAILGGAAAAGAAIISAPYIRNAEAAETTTWKVQTSWPAGVGLNTFKTWAASIKEKTSGELEFKPFAAKEVVGDFELLEGHRMLPQHANIRPQKMVVWERGPR